jgi:hypothetical protein
MLRRFVARVVAFVSRTFKAMAYWWECECSPGGVPGNKFLLVNSKTPDMVIGVEWTRAGLKITKTNLLTSKRTIEFIEATPCVY